MLHAQIVCGADLRKNTTHGAPPLTPAAYLRLRRRAAGMSIDDVADVLATCSAGFARSEAAALIRMLETPGARARHLDPIWRLAAVFPIDPDVYHQLATEPPHRHPMVCRACGCSKFDPCEHAILGPCDWAAAHLCTRCTTAGHH